MMVAVFHALSLASAGGRLEPLRKKRRENVMNIKVWKIFHTKAALALKYGSSTFNYLNLEPIQNIPLYFTENVHLCILEMQ